MSPKIGRNDHCPCGSGLKYKHCHGGPRAATPEASVGDGRETAVERALGWLTDRHRKAVQVALDDLLSGELWPEDASEAGELDAGLHEMLMVNLFEWLLAEGEIQIKGQRCNVNRYVLGADGPTFSATERQWIEQLAGQPLRPYTIAEVRRGEGLTLVDALDEEAEPVFVQERSGSEALRAGMLIGCRAMVLGDRRVLSGAVYPFPMLGVAEVLAAIRAEVEDANPVSDLPRAEGLAVARAWVRRAVLPPPLPTMVDAISGDPLLLVTDHYRVLDADALARALAACGDVVSEGVGEWRREREFDDGLTRSLAAINRGKQADRIEVFVRRSKPARCCE
ncbi:MAG: SEC-C metal-binding domain-containing protein [Betaproteobacteria bacterium]